MATTKYNWKDIQGANLRAKLDNVVKTKYTDSKLYFLSIKGD